MIMKISFNHFSGGMNVGKIPRFSRLGRRHQSADW